MRMFTPRMQALFASVAVIVCLSAPGVLASWTMPIQGVLTDAEGVALDGFVQASFSLYASAGDTVPVWAELVELDVRSGAFTTYLGASAPVMPQLEAANGPLWLGVSIDGDD